jgi:hypothetical protein
MADIHTHTHTYTNIQNLPKHRKIPTNNPTLNSKLFLKARGSGMADASSTTKKQGTKDHDIHVRPKNVLIISVVVCVCVFVSVCGYGCPK